MPAAAWRRILVSAVLPWLAAAAPPGAPPQAIGSWLLQCPASGGCILRDRDWILPPGGSRPGAALEIRRRGDWLVPVVALRGLSAEQALGALLALQPHVTLSFAPGPRAVLTCALDAEAVVCAPEGNAVAATAAALHDARSVEVAVRLGIPGMTPLPARGRSLALLDTPRALARLNSVATVGEPPPAVPGLDWLGFIHKIMQATGFGYR